MLGVSNRAGTDQLVALLGPDAVAAGVDPHRPSARVVSSPPHDGGVAVGGQCDGPALAGGPNRSGADQLVALLGPDTAAAGKDPRCPDACGAHEIAHVQTVAEVIQRRAHDGGVAVGGQRDGRALAGVSDRADADQLGPLLRELGKRQLRGEK